MVYSVSPNLPPKSLPVRTVETSSHSSSTLVGSSDSPSNISTTSSSDSEQDSDSDSDEDSATADSEQEDDEEEETLKLEQLLIKAKQSAKQKQLAEKEKKNGVKGGEGDGLAGNEEMVLFGEEDESEEDDSDSDNDNGTPKASTSKSSSKTISLPPSLVQPLSLAPPTSISTNSASVKGKGRAGPISLSQDLSGILTTSHSTTKTTTSNGQGEKWGMAPVPRLSKKQYKANQPHTAGSKWFDMPATPMTPELKREIDAMRLRNALDPKKFMKGSAKNEKIGEFFQVGHVITPNTRATTSNSLPTASKRSFVEELVEDEQARAYAKRKTKEVMQKGMSGRKRQRKGAKGSYAMGMGGGKDGAGSAGGKRRKR
ncbi:hypothetical protein JCM5350_003455 [Sporobolomyces pararoseus]